MKIEVVIKNGFPEAVVQVVDEIARKFPRESPKDDFSLCGRITPWIGASISYAM
jgi:hypothetical protein